MKLTSKQEAFCKAIALQGKNQTEAYKLSYNTLKMSDKVICKEASILMKSRKIAVRIKELKEQLTEKTIEKLVYTDLQSFNELTELQDNAKEAGNLNIAVRCEELKGKLANLYVERKRVDFNIGMHLKQLTEL